MSEPLHTTMHPFRCRHCGHRQKYSTPCRNCNKVTKSVEATSQLSQSTWAVYGGHVLENHIRNGGVGYEKERLKEKVERDGKGASEKMEF